MTKKKILYLDTPLEPPGGGQISLLTLLKNIDRKEVEFKVFINRDGVFKKMLEKNNIYVEVVWITKLFSKIKEYNPDIIHINSACTKYTFFSAFFSKILSKKVVWHNRVIETAPFKERIISLFVDKIIVISDAVGKKFYYASDKLVKIYNPLNINDIKIEVNPNELRKELNIPADAKIIGIFSRLEKWKGHSLLFETFSRINNNIYLLVCGEGSEKESLKKLTVEFGISERVIFCGFVENVYDYINISDIVINPSIKPEPFGRIIIEAMALGKPVIASVGGVEEIIDNGIDGLLIKTSQELKDAIIRLLSDESFYYEISANAKNKAQRFDVRYHLNEIMKVYEELGI